MGIIIGLIGTCLMVGSGVTYFYGPKAGVCATLFVAGFGLLIDSLRK